MDRRTFLAATAAAAASVGTSASASAGAGANADECRPARSTPLRPGYFGTQFYGDEERRELIDVLESRSPFRWYGPGKEPPQKVISFEKAFAPRMKSRFALAVTSGTAALQTALAALEVGPGDEVILPAFAWYSCYNAIVLAGALPVFAEADESLNMDPADVEAKVTPQTKAIMAVHLLGGACDMDRIVGVAKEQGIKVLEDCAQSLGASYKGRPAGSLGHVGIYSMQINKAITSGEGGALVTDDAVLFERASRFHDLGLFRAPHEQEVGGSHVEPFAGSQFRMSEFTGAVLRAQLRKLDTIVDSVRKSAKRVREGIADLPGIRFRDSADPAGDLGSHVFIRFDSKAMRDRFLAGMSTERIAASAPSGSVHLPTVPYIAQKRTAHPNWPSFNSERGRSIRYGPACCPRTLEMLSRYAAILIGPKYTEGDAEDIISAVRKVHRAATEA